ncbi:hypothetical protein KAH37_01860 [bacterium]|nr:hypothetical protein [bacterium]
MQKKRTPKAFTLIELMLGIVLSVMVLATFFRFFAHVNTAEKNNNYKSSNLARGASSLQIFADATRLIGLTTTNLEFVSAAPRIIQETLGTTDGNDNVVFTFNSVFGGPITKILDEPTSCTLRIERTAAIASNPLTSLRIATKDDVYYVGYGWINSDRVSITTKRASNGANVSAPCQALFKKGDLVTGPNYFYRLTWVKNANLKFQRIFQPVPFSFDPTTTFGAGREVLLDIPAGQVKLVILQFLTQDTTTLEEIWENGLAYTIDDYRDIKAVRIAVVLLPRTSKDLKGASSTGPSQTICPFSDLGCVTLNDLSRPPIVFKKVIYLKNLDYAKRSATP